VMSKWTLDSPELLDCAEGIAYVETPLLPGIHAHELCEMCPPPR
jgi:hypothetical protein